VSYGQPQEVGQLAHLNGQAAAVLEDLPEDVAGVAL
jgi:hypothetical protein